MSKFTKHIIKSLNNQPGDWSISNHSMTKPVECNWDDFGARKTTSRIYIRDVTTEWIELVHVSGEIKLIDSQPHTYYEWDIKYPAHVHFSWWERRSLSKAVLFWREHDIQSLKPKSEEDELEIALAELEKEII